MRKGKVKQQKYIHQFSCCISQISVIFPRILHFATYRGTDERNIGIWTKRSKGGNTGEKNQSNEYKKEYKYKWLGIKGGNPENAIGNSKDTLLRILWRNLVLFDVAQCVQCSCFQLWRKMETNILKNISAFWDFIEFYGEKSIS